MRGQNTRTMASRSHPGVRYHTLTSIDGLNSQIFLVRLKSIFAFINYNILFFLRVMGVGGGGREGGECTSTSRFFDSITQQIVKNLL